MEIGLEKQCDRIFNVEIRSASWVQQIMLQLWVLILVKECWKISLFTTSGVCVCVCVCVCGICVCCIDTPIGPVKNTDYAFFFNKFIYLFLTAVFIAVRRLSLVVVSGGYSLLWCAGFSFQWLLLLRSTGSRCTGSVVVVHGLSCSAACGIFPDQGLNLCPLHWQADS